MNERLEQIKKLDLSNDHLKLKERGILWNLIIESHFEEALKFMKQEIFEDEALDKSLEGSIQLLKFIKLC